MSTIHTYILEAQLSHFGGFYSNTHRAFSKPQTLFGIRKCSLQGSLGLFRTTTLTTRSMYMYSMHSVQMILQVSLKSQAYTSNNPSTTNLHSEPYKSTNIHPTRSRPCNRPVNPEPEIHEHPFHIFKYIRKTYCARHQLIIT